MSNQEQGLNVINVDNIKKEYEGLKEKFNRESDNKKIAEIMLKLNLDINNPSHIDFAIQVYDKVIGDYKDEIDYALEKNDLLRQTYHKIVD